MSTAASASIRLGTAIIESKHDTKTIGDDSETKTIDLTRKIELSHCLGKNNLKPSTLDKTCITVSSEDLAALYDPLALAGLIPYMKPGSEISICVVTGDGLHSADYGVINTSFLLAGLKAESERIECGNRIFTARKKKESKRMTTSMTLNFSKVTPEETKSKVMLTNLDDADDLLIDEDELLVNEGSNGLLQAPPAYITKNKKSLDDCGGRKPCDNCTCGRAEREAGVTDAAPVQAPSSSCGKCSLGDAFRCASCPYLGKPAFKPGEEHLVLDLADDI